MSRPTDWYVLDLSGDPVPGDPSTVSDVARKWSSVADDADTARTQISSLLGDQAVMQWLGKAGDAFRSHSNKLPGQLQKCSDSYHQAASALSSWSTQLDAHQGVADHALVLGRAALTDLHNAQGTLSAAQGNATSAQSQVNANTATTRQAAHDSTVPPPDPAQVRAAVNRAAAASQAVTSAQHAVGEAQARLDAAKRMAADAASARDGDGRTTSSRLHDAADAGIHPDSFWHKLGDALGKAWHVLVEIAKVVVVIAAVIAIVVGGPIAWVVFAAAVIILADTVAQYAQGKASLLDVGMAALGCIPGEGMLEDLSVVSRLADDTTAVRTATQDTTTVVRDTTDAADGAATSTADGAPVPEPAKEPAMAGGGSGGGGDKPPTGGDGERPPTGGGSEDPPGGADGEPPSDPAPSPAKKPPAKSPQFQKPTNPPQDPPDELPPGHSVRQMPPTEQYPDGYWVETNSHGQPVDPSTGKPPSNVTRAEARARTHVPLPPPP